MLTLRRSGETLYAPHNTTKTLLRRIKDCVNKVELSPLLTNCLCISRPSCRFLSSNPPAFCFDRPLGLEGPPKSIPTTENGADCSTRRAGNGAVT
ncbi:hypothetical protein TNCV_2453331 [Trichonephila clavipes]|nr:hypothetical protein TNCV_2453331 [Trichonephila clavipes]